MILGLLTLLAKMINAPKRIAIMIQMCLTFPKYQKQKFLTKFDYGVIKKLVGELWMRNMIFRTHNNKT